MWIPDTAFLATYHSIKECSKNKRDIIFKYRLKIVLSTKSCNLFHERLTKFPDFEDGFEFAAFVTREHDIRQFRDRDLVLRPFKAFRGL